MPIIFADEDHPLYDLWIDYLTKRNYSLDIYALADREYEKQSIAFKEKFKKIALCAYEEADRLFHEAKSIWQKHVSTYQPKPIIIWDYGVGQGGYNCIVFNARDDNYYKFNHRSFCVDISSNSLPSLEKRLEGLVNYTVFYFKRVKV